MENREIKPQLKRGLWKPEEDLILKNYVETHGEGNWATVSKRSGLMRGGKSCRLRWKNYLRPNIKRGGMSEEEEDLIIRMHKLLGNRWSLIAGRLPGRTDNEVKNYWNTHLNKKCLLGKRKTLDTNIHTHAHEENKLNGEKRQRLDNSPPTCNKGTPVCSTAEGGSEGEKEVKEESNVGDNWMEDVDCFKREVDSPLMLLGNSMFALNDEPFAASWDSFPLFETYGCSGEETLSEFLRGFWQ
ncbi:hypothetical protein SLEP1_g27616 [Rubroshorea leprosula]|uniref:Uncharacterized protein n=1 Tax=Rubroshorea leprosula TaxID=152421 RepID=A0AAV5JQZ4_9ROSI|nr:hypothetical protein SLEP1_g27616 [Rubroshorea leprosula]